MKIKKGAIPPSCAASVPEVSNRRFRNAFHFTNQDMLLLEAPRSALIASIDPKKQYFGYLYISESNLCFVTKDNSFTKHVDAIKISLT